MKEMNVILVDQKSSKFTFEHDPCQDNPGGKWEYSLQDRTPNGKGVIQGNEFPWRVEPRKFTDDPNFSVRVFITLEKDQWLRFQVNGDFREILKYVFGIIADPYDMKLSLQGSLAFLDGAASLCIVHEKLGSKVGSSGNIFLPKSMSISEHFLHGYPLFETFIRLDWSFARKMRESVGKIWSATFSIELHGGEMTPLPSIFSGTHVVRELNQTILEQKIKTDFVLVSKNGVEFPCHKSFLQASCPSFDLKFESEENPNGVSSSPLNLTEEGMKAFLEFVYCLQTDAPMDDSNIALELLQVGIDKEMPVLQKVMTDLIILRVDDWFDLEGALKLYFICGKTLDHVQQKALKAIKLKRWEIDESPFCSELFKKDPESAFKLFKSVLMS